MTSLNSLHVLSISSCRPLSIACLSVFFSQYSIYNRNSYKHSSTQRIRKYICSLELSTQNMNLNDGTTPHDNALHQCVWFLRVKSSNLMYLLLHILWAWFNNDYKFIYLNIHELSVYLFLFVLFGRWFLYSCSFRTWADLRFRRWGLLTRVPIIMIKYYVLRVLLQMGPKCIMDITVVLIRDTSCSFNNRILQTPDTPGKRLSTNQWRVCLGLSLF